MNAGMTSFDEFLDLREKASTAFVEGDADPLLDLSATDDPASIYPPTGAVVRGAQAVNVANLRDSRLFTPAAQNRFEILHSGSDGDLGYWTGLQHSRVNMNGSDASMEMTLRVTELFRRTNGRWALFHRHADRVPEA